jgi:predicted metal-binding membrane protein
VTAPALQRAAWRHPEAAAGGVAVVAWLLLLVAAAAPQPHAGHHPAGTTETLPGVAGGWLLMTVAMMVPGALAACRHLALGALWSRRQRTIALFLGAYLAVWAGFGIAAWSLGRLLGLTAAAVLPAALAAAAVWQLTPWKWRAVRACHRLPPLPPRGVRADAACAATGATYGRRCVVACWPPMLGMAVAGHGSVVLMLVLTGLVSAEKLAARPARLAVPGAVALAAAAATTLVLGPVTA